ncbi:MAG: DegT/DnrJ/EryC1/StrS family aminotransferase [bacterium]
MTIPFFDLQGQYLTIKEEIDEAMAGVLARGWYVLGDEVRSFEHEFAAYCGAGYAVGVGSGTDAIMLALLACGIAPGDEVITVPNTAVPTVAAIIAAQARPVFVDVDPDTRTMDPMKLEICLATRRSSKVRAVIPVHLYGHPADMTPILDIARRYGLRVIEDACQAHGAEYRSVKAGTLGDAGCFSFYPTKNLGAYGDGGMVTVHDENLAERLRMLRNYGEREKYRNAIHGYNSRLDEVQAAVLRVKLRHLDVWNRRRRNIADLYNSLLLPCTEISLPGNAQYARHVFHLYVIRTRRRDMLRERLKRHGIHTLIHYPLPVHFQEAYQSLGYAQGDFPVSERLASEILSLPLYPELDEDTVSSVCSVIREGAH